MGKSQKEIVLEEDITAEAEAAGWLVYKMQFIGRRGCPDRWFFRQGELVIIEFKRRGETPDGLQRKTHDRFRGQGFKVHVIDNHDDARRVLGLGGHG